MYLFPLSHFHLQSCRRILNFGAGGERLIFHGVLYYSAQNDDAK